MKNVYEQTIDKLKSSADEKYKEFNDKILMSKSVTLGVRVPIIKKIAKDIPKDKTEEYLSLCEFRYYEDTLVYGFLLSRLPFGEMLSRKDVYLARCDCWANIDTFVPTLKIAKNDREKFFDYVKQNIKGSEGFYLRFYLVSLMDFYLDEEHIDEVLKIAEEYDGKGYYNDMAIAWLVSIAFVKFRDKTMAFLKDNKLSAFTQNKSISKISDSFRATKEDKEYLKQNLRKK